MLGEPDGPFPLLSDGQYKHLYRSLRIPPSRSADRNTVDLLSQGGAPLASCETVRLEAVFPITLPPRHLLSLPAPLVSLAHPALVND